MRDMFNGCKLLKFIPDISKWDISKVTDISGMFSACESLLSLPDISIWNTSNVPVS
jgi:surface protein